MSFIITVTKFEQVLKYEHGGHMKKSKLKPLRNVAFLVN